MAMALVGLDPVFWWYRESPTLTLLTKEEGTRKVG
jgi:hypothetical protein